MLEFFVVGKIARMLAFTVMTPDDRPQFITYAISILYLLYHVPADEPGGNHFIQGYKDIWNMGTDLGMNFPMAIFYQMFYCGPLVRLIFRTIFREKKTA